MARSDRYTELTHKEELYSDFLTNINPHPVSGQLLRVVNEAAVVRSIKNLISTNRGERLYQPSIGSDIRKMLFENVNDAAAESISTMVQETIKQHEPRARVLKVNVVAYPDQHRYVVTIVFMVINKTEPISVDVTLTRVR